MAFALNSHASPWNGWDGTRNGLPATGTIERMRDDGTMSNRQNQLLWMKDLIEHMTQCHEQLQWAADGRTETFLTETLMGDLAQCRRLCEELRTNRAKGRMLNPV